MTFMCFRNMTIVSTASCVMCTPTLLQRLAYTLLAATWLHTPYIRGNTLITLNLLILLLLLLLLLLVLLILLLQILLILLQLLLGQLPVILPLSLQVRLLQESCCSRAVALGSSCLKHFVQCLSPLRLLTAMIQSEIITTASLQGAYLYVLVSLNFLCSTLSCYL